MPIEQLRPGDLVTSREEHGGKQSARAVVRTIRTQPDTVDTIRFMTWEGEEFELRSTPEHPFYVLSRERAEFIAAGELEHGDLVSLADGSVAEVVGHASERADQIHEFTTYNLEINEFHTYFVGEHGVWVHNEGWSCAQWFSLHDRIKRRNPAWTKWQVGQETFRQALAAGGRSVRRSDSMVAWCQTVVDECAAEAVTTGDILRAPSYAKWQDVLEPYLAINNIDIHHGATKHWTRRLFYLYNLPEPDISLLNQMPSVPLPITAHRAGHGPYPGMDTIHDLIRAQIGDTTELYDDPQEILDGLATAYEHFHDDYSEAAGCDYRQFWSVTREWLRQRGIQ